MKVEIKENLGQKKITMRMLSKFKGKKKKKMNVQENNPGNIMNISRLRRLTKR